TVIWYPWIPFALFNYDSQPVPTGLSSLVDLSFLFTPGVNAFVFVLSLGLLHLYIRGRHLRLVTGGMFLLTLLVYTLHDAQGSFTRNDVLTMIVAGQFLAHLFFHGQDPQTIRDRAISYSKQALLAAFFISGVTKVQTSGLDWVLDAPNISLQMYKSNMSNFLSLEWEGFRWMAENWSQLFAENATLVRCLFAVVLLLELCCPVAMLSKKAALRVGWALVLLQGGFVVFLGVLFPSFLGSTLIFLVNVPAGLSRLEARFRRKSTPSSISPTT
ncbi:MAG: hypothetical protein AAF570_13165, partial [Bacteroidota bacterium]